jgi:hypothetical protein
MKQYELQLIVSFLRDHADDLDNHCCNDWECPSEWSVEEARDFCKQYQKWNGDEDSDDDCFNDSVVCDFLADKFEKEIRR